MGVNKVEYGGNTLIDLTSDTVTANDLRVGVTAHDARGELIVGKYAKEKRYKSYFDYSINDEFSFDLNTDLDDTGALFSLTNIGDNFSYPISIEGTYRLTSLEFERISTGTVQISVMGIVPQYGFQVITKANLITGRTANMPVHFYSITALNQNTILIGYTSQSTETTIGRLTFFPVQIVSSTAAIAISTSTLVPQATGTITLKKAGSGTGRRIYGYICKRSVIDNTLILFIKEEYKNNVTGVIGNQNLWVYRGNIDVSTDSSGKAILYFTATAIHTDSLTASQSGYGSLIRIKKVYTKVCDIYSYIKTIIDSKGNITNTENNYHLNNYRNGGGLLSSVSYPAGDVYMYESSMSYGRLESGDYIGFNNNWQKEFFYIYKYYSDYGNIRVPSGFVTKDEVPSDDEHPAATLSYIKSLIEENTGRDCSIMMSDGVWYSYLGDNYAVIRYGYEDENRNPTYFALIRFFQYGDILTVKLIETDLTHKIGIRNSGDNPGVYTNYERVIGFYGEDVEHGNRLGIGLILNGD